MLYKKFISILVLLIILFPISSVSANSSDIKSTDFLNLPFKQEIEIPFDTSTEYAKYQPIDIRMEFSDNCYAKDVKNHSVRIGFDTGSEILELESQIYDLEFTDENHISACNIVFLIPGEATGEEKYYVFYDSKETEPVNYEKHLDIEDTHYFYEPISGQKIDFDYYKVAQHDEIIYGLVQKGELLGNPVAQNIGRFKPGSKIVETYNIDQLAGFDMRYGIKNEPGYYGTTWATEVEKSVLVQGNLMVRVRVACLSPDGEIKTDNIYTYYYCPGEIKRIYVNCHHEVLTDIEVDDPEVYVGTYAGIVSVKARSATIEKMNVGELLPELNVYSEEEIIREYEVPLNPDSIEKESVLTTDADVDLGSKAWISLNNPSTGKTHGLIMDSSTGINPDEDGIQVKAFVKQNLKLPGLEADSGNIFLMRNSYEKDYCEDKQIKKGFTADYNVEFLSVEDNGKEIITAESDIFQALSQNFIFNRGEETKIEETEEERYQLKTVVHLAPSIPLGSLLSAALGKNISYIYAELYKEETFRSSGSVGRISITGTDLDFEGKTLIEKIKMAVGLFDWKNASFFKKIVFPDIESGKYTVKIFKENPLFSKERQFIGFTTVDIKEDTTSNIYCSPQGSIDVTILDQDDKPVEGVVYSLEYGGNVISDGLSSLNGTCIINAPCKSSENYVLKAFYNGFLVHEQSIKLGLKNYFKPISIKLSIERYSLLLDIKDTWGFKPAVDVNPVLTSEDMQLETKIIPEKIDSGSYVFNGLTKGNYILLTSYKSFEKIEEINIQKDKTIELIFPAEYAVGFNLYDNHAQSLSEGKILIKRNVEETEVEINKKGLADINVPPGDYDITVLTSNGETIGKLGIQVRSDKTVELVTKEDSFIHTFTLFFGLLLVFASFYLAFVRKQKHHGLKLFVIALVLISIFSPWWSLNGDNGSVETSTKVLIFPQKITTLTTATNSIGGEISQVPEEATMALEILFMILLFVMILNLISIFTKNRLKKISKILSILSFVFLLLSVLLFYIVISQLTELGVGSIIGSGNLDTNIPGGLQSEIVECSWGPGLGFYLTLFVLIIIAVLQIFKRKISNFLERKNL